MRRRLLAAATGALACVLAGCSLMPGTGSGDGAGADDGGATPQVQTSDAKPSSDPNDPEPDESEPAEEETTEESGGQGGWNIDTTVPVLNDTLLGSNPLFQDPDMSIDTVGCSLPSWSLDAGSAAAYYEAAIKCHHEAWKGAFAQIGIELQLPDLWGGAASADYDGGCGSNTTGREAFYCSVDQTIVMPFDTMESIAQYGEGYALAVISHEYGHHLQQQAGVFAAFSARGNEVGWESADGQLLNRMLELQAWCFSGMFYGTNVGSGDITQGLWEQAYDNNSHAGDRQGELRYHGTNESIANWFSWGAEPGDEASSSTPSPYECNPWAARSQDWLQ